jgi:hypothetical protein
MVRHLILALPSEYLAFPSLVDWTHAYPPGVYDLAKTPKEWLDALDAADSAGLIPKIPVATVPPGKSPTYGHEDPTSDEICSSTYQCRGTDDVWDAPDGHIGIG